MMYMKQTKLVLHQSPSVVILYALGPFTLGHSLPPSQAASNILILLCTTLMAVQATSIGLLAVRSAIESRIQRRTDP
jgi:hypothetical protein